MKVVLARDDKGGDWSFNQDQWARITNNSEDFTGWRNWRLVNVEEPQCESDDYYNRPCYCGEI